MSADQQQNDQSTDDQDQTPAADQIDQTGGDNDQHGRETRQDRRDRQARERASELEAERDKLAARLDARDTAEVVRLAGEILAQGSDLLDLGGVSLDDLRDENGDINADEVAAMAAALVDQRPGLGVPKPRGYSDWGHTRRNDVGFEGEGETTWAGAFGAAGRGGAHYT